MMRSLVTKSVVSPEFGMSPPRAIVFVVLAFAVVPAQAQVIEAQAGVIEIAEIRRESAVDFQTEVLPILKRNCLACHNAAKAEGELVLETPQTIAKGGADGKVVATPA